MPLIIPFKTKKSSVSQAIFSAEERIKQAYPSSDFSIKPEQNKLIFGFNTFEKATPFAVKKVEIPTTFQQGFMENGKFVVRDITPRGGEIKEAPRKTGFFEEVKRFGIRTGVGFISNIAKSAEFFTNLVSRHILDRASEDISIGIGPVKLFQPRVVKETQQAWKDFYDKKLEEGELPTQQFREFTDKLQNQQYLQPSKGYQEASLKEKMTTRLGETILILGPGVVSSIGTFIINPLFGYSVIVGATADDVTEDAVSYGVPRDQAELLGVGTGLLVGALEKIVPDRIFSTKGIKNDFIGSFARRLTNSVILEVGTEVTQEDIQIIAEATFRDDLGWDEIATRNVMAGFGGIIGGVGMQTIASFSNDVQRKQILQIIREQPLGLSIKKVEEEPLAIEARKFKTAEEYLRSRTGYSIGTGVEKPIFDTSGNKIGRLILNENSKEIQIKDIIRDKEIGKGIPTKIINDLKEYAIGKDKQLSLSPIVPGTEKFWEKLGFIKDKTGKYFFDKAKTKPKTKIQKAIEREVGITKEKIKITLTEDKLLKDRIKELQRRAKAENWSAVKLQRLINATEEKLAKVKREGELKVIKVGITERFKGIQRGIREGRIKTKTEIQSVQNTLINIINESELELNDKAKFIKTIKNVQTAEALVKVLPKIEERITALEESAEIRGLRKQIKKELKTIKPRIQAGKKVGRFTPIYQEIVDTIGSVMKMTQETRDETIDSIIQKSDKGVEIVDQLKLELIDKVNQGKYGEILSILQKAKKEGKEINELKAFNRYSQKLFNIEKSVDTITGGQPIPDRPDVGAYKNNFLKRVRQLLFVTGQSQMHLQSVLDVLSSNDKTSKTYQSFLNKFGNFQANISEEKGSLNEHITEVNTAFGDIYNLKRKGAIAKKMRQDSKVESLGTFKNVFGNEVELMFSKAEVRKRYMEFQDETLNSTWEASGWTQQMRNTVTNSLSIQDKKWANWQLDFYNKYYNEVNKVYTNLYNLDLGRTENYSPIRRQKSTLDDFSGFGEFLQEPVYRRSVTSASLKGRVVNTERIKEQSDVGVLATHLSQMEHFIHFAEKIQEVRDVFFDPEFRNAVEAFYGKKTNSIVSGFIDDITVNGMTRAQNNEKLEALMGAMATGVLAVKPSITIKQLTSFPAFAAQMPIKPYVSGLTEFWLNPVKHSKFLFKNSKDLQTRGFNVTRDMISLSKTENYTAIMSKKRGFKDIISLNIMAGDKGAIVAGGYPVYKYHYNLAKEAGKSETEAVEQGILEFETAFNLTQQTANIQGLSQFQRGGIFMRLYSAFLSSPNLYLQMEGAAIRGAITKRMPLREVAKIIFIFHFLLPNLFVLAGNLFDEDKLDVEEHILASIIGPLVGIYVVGDMIESIVRAIMGMRVFDNEQPIYRIVDETIKLIRDLKDDDAEEVLEMLNQISDIGTTLPYIAPGAAVVSQGLKGIEGMIDILNGDFREGAGLMFGYTRYSVGKRDGDKSSIGGAIDFGFGTKNDLGDIKLDFGF